MPQLDIFMFISVYCTLVFVVLACLSLFEAAYFYKIGKFLFTDFFCLQAQLFYNKFNTKSLV